MTNSQFRALLTQYNSSKAMACYTSKAFPSRRQAKSTSHGDMRIMDKRFRVIPGIRIER
jgi:hypothetical protein